MSEARERLIAARRFTQLASEREAALITFLSRPDDLLAVLVEEGVLATYRPRGPDLYRRTEGRTPDPSKWTDRESFDGWEQG